MDRELLHRVCRLADEVLRPRAAEADRGDIHGPVADNIHHLGAAGFFGLGIAPEYGGLGADEVTRHEYAEILASACGVTAFTQQQLQTGVKFVTEAANEALKRELLPALAAGRLHCGIALSHLRRPGPPLGARRAGTRGGYRLNGVIPWITGWSLLDGFVLGAVLENGDHLFAHVDRTRARGRAHGERAAASDRHGGLGHGRGGGPGPVPPGRRRAAPPAGRGAAAGRRIGASPATPRYPWAVPAAGARYLRELAQQPGREALSRTAIALTFEIDQCRREALTWNCECVEHPDTGPTRCGRGRGPSYWRCAPPTRRWSPPGAART